MKSSSPAEFAQFRFVRNSVGEVINLPSPVMDERTLLVTDCEQWGLSRLHIFEGAANRTEVLDAFQHEMERISEIQSEAISRVAVWGRDDEELFYADEFQDSEGLPDYLERTGRVPVAVSAEWVMQLIDLLEVSWGQLVSFERFSTQNFQVVMDRLDRIRPIFSEFHGWTKPGIQVQEHSREWYLAQIFCSLVGGVPIREFHRDSLPRNFDELDEETRDAVLASLDGDTSAQTYARFRDAMVALAVEAESQRSEVQIPRRPVREWLAEDLKNSYSGDAEFELPDEIERGVGPYAVPSVIRGTPSEIQLLPGPDSIPREGWLNQHHEVTRRPGRVKLNQLQVNYIEDRGAVTLVGEEAVEGVDLGVIVQENGSLSIGDCGILADRISSALSILEGDVGSCAVWWLPPGNIILMTGSSSRSGSCRLIQRKGTSAWQQLPIKLRLHQTTMTLREGVGLPPRVRDMARLHGKQFEPTRRSAIALPVIWYLLTGARFRWQQKLSHQNSVGHEIPDSVMALLERYRLRLTENPADLEYDLFSEFRRVMNSEARPEYTEIEEPGWGDAFETMMDGVLYDGDIDLKLSKTPAGDQRPASESIEES